MSEQNQVFSIAYCRQDTVQRKRHGLIWTQEEYNKLRDHFDNGVSLRTMCDLMARPADGIVAKLKQLGLIYMENATGQYLRRHPPINCVQQSESESIMNETTKPAPANFELKTLIQGRDGSQMTDAEIFRVIAKLEKEQEALESVKNKPKKLVAAIEALTAEIKSIVDYVDAR